MQFFFIFSLNYLDYSSFMGSTNWIAKMLFGTSFGFAKMLFGTSFGLVILTIDLDPALPYKTNFEPFLLIETQLGWTKNPLID